MTIPLILMYGCATTKPENKIHPDHDPIKVMINNPHIPDDVVKGIREWNYYDYGCDCYKKLIRTPGGHYEARVDSLGKMLRLGF